MRSFRHIRQLVALGMAVTHYSYSQSHQSPHHALTPIAPDENKAETLPARQLTFTGGEPAGSLKASPAIILPVQCTSDGALFFDMLQPPSFMQQAVYAVTPKSSQAFATSAIDDLHGVELISFFPGDARISLLVRATKETTPLSGESTIRQSTYKFFLALYNRQGNYLKSVELAMHDVVPSHIAELNSGEFLVTGYDRANDLPRLYLVADDGRVIRTLILPDSLAQYVPSDDPNSGTGLMNTSRVLGSILMTPHGEEVLVWRRGAMGPILSVGAHGSSREITLDVPKGLALADIIPSDTLWVAHFQEVRKQPSQEQNPRQMSYYQFDPSDGSLTSRLSISGDSPEHTPVIIACEEQGSFLSYQTDDKGQMHILSAR